MIQVEIDIENGFFLRCEVSYYEPSKPAIIMADPNDSEPPQGYLLEFQAWLCHVDTDREMELDEEQPYNLVNGLDNKIIAELV